MRLVNRPGERRWVARRWSGLGLALAALILAGAQGALAQNLVPNGDFESYSGVPTSIASGGEVNLANFWSSPTNATPDYYHALATAASFVSVPVNGLGNQAAHSGSAYVGFHARPVNNYREYVETPLSSPLVAGQTYQVSFYVSLADGARWAVDRIGAYLSVGPVGPVNTAAPLPFTPQIAHPIGNYITNKTGWTLITGPYVAAGGEDHLVIGNFADNASTVPLPVGGPFQFAYYYLDDVSVIPTCVPPPSGLVAWWPLDEQTGAAVVNDVASPPSSTASNQGTPKPGGLLGGPNGPTVVPGQVGSALYFAGAYVEVASQADVNFGTGDFTIDGWLKPVSLVDANALSLVVHKIDANGTGYALYTLGDGAGGRTLNLVLNGSTYTSAPGITSTGWYLVAVTVERSSGPPTGTFSINGAPAGTFTPVTSNLDNASPLLIGASFLPGLPGLPAVGRHEFALDELEIFKRGLGPGEIQAIYNAGSAGKCKPCLPPPSGMVAWYPFDSGTGTTQIHDIAPPPGSTVNNVGVPQPGAVGPPGPPPVGPAPVAGHVGTALYFYGPYVEVAPHPELDFSHGDFTVDAGVTAFSIDAWVRIVPVAPPLIQPIVDKLGSPNGPGFAFYVRNQRLELNLNGTAFVSTGTLAAFANPLLDTGPWYHVAVTVEGGGRVGQGAFYIDGVQVGTFTPSAGSINNGSPLWIGETRLPGPRGELAIDELEVFNRALLPADVEAIHAAGATGKCKRLPVPDGPNVFGCLPAPSAPVFSTTPARAQPLFVSNPTPTDVLIGLAFGAFSGPVDIYSAVQTPLPYPYDLLVRAGPPPGGWVFQPLPVPPPPLSANSAAGIDMTTPSESLHHGPVGAIAPGTYTFYQIVVPAGTDPGTFDFATSPHYTWCHTKTFR
jgi:hypothetical protein